MAQLWQAPSYKDGVMEFKRIPKFIDAPIQFLWWEAQEGAIIVIATIASLILVRQPIFGVVAGVIIASKFAKFKEDNLKGYFTHILNYYGFLNAKKGVKPYQKLIIR